MMTIHASADGGKPISTSRTALEKITVKASTIVSPNTIDGPVNLTGAGGGVALAGIERLAPHRLQ